MASQPPTQMPINGVGKLVRESVAERKPSEFMAEVAYALGSLELFFGTPEGTDLTAPRARFLRSYVRVIAAQLEFVLEAHEAAAVSQPLADDERAEMLDLADRADEIIDSLGWSADEELNGAIRQAASRAAT